MKPYPPDSTIGPSILGTISDVSSKQKPNLRIALTPPLRTRLANGIHSLLCLYERLDAFRNYTLQEGLFRFPSNKGKHNDKRS